MATLGRALLALSVPVLVLHFAQHSTALDLKPRGSWERGTITWYGGEDAQGTNGGACGYGNLEAAGYSLMTAAASEAMWAADPAICGACFEVQCVDSPLCYNSTSVVVTVTNLCPKGSEGGWCDAPKRHLDMAFPAFKSIVAPNAGHVTTQMRRVACPSYPNIKLMLTGSIWYTEVLVRGVGGPGTVSMLEISNDGEATWKPANRAWGTVFQLSEGNVGKSLSFRLTSGDGTEKLVLKGCAPEGWQLGQEFSCGGNFN